MHLNDIENATVLAALRFWQRKGNTDDLPEWDIATCGGELTVHLDDSDIDELVERLNVVERAPRVLVKLEGGLVQGAVADIPVELTVLDYDVEGCDQITDATYAIPQLPAAHTEDAFRSQRAVDVDSGWIDTALAAPLAMPEDLDMGRRCERWVYHNVGEYPVAQYTPQLGFQRNDAACSMFTASFYDSDGDLEEVSFMVPGDDRYGDRVDIARRAIEAVYGPVTKLGGELRDPITKGGE